MHHIDGAHTQTGCQHAVVAGGCAATLNMAQNSVAGFDSGAFLNLLGEVFTDTAQAGATVLFRALIRQNLVKAFGNKALGNHDKRGTATIVYFFHPVADFVH